jgi:hypothetical protein
MLVSALVLVVCVAGSLGALLTAKGSVVPDPAARKVATAAKQHADEVTACTGRAADLSKEYAVFKDVAPATGIDKEPAPPEPEPKTPPRPGQPKPKPKTEIAAPAWPAAKPTQERAKSLVACKALLVAASEPSAAAAKAWASVEAAAAVPAPPEGDGAQAQTTAARSVYVALDGAPIGEIEAHEAAATAAAKKSADEAADAAAKATVVQGLPKGVLGREVAVAAGVLLSLVALLINFFSLRATSARRAQTLVPLRKATRPPERGLHAAALLRVAAEGSGGEPGLVLGAAIGGLVAAVVGRQDADWYVAGVTAGLILGLLIQIVARSTAGTKAFRARALALAEIEKPAVPIVLVLSTVQPGMEGEFLGFFLKLSPSEAANAVEKLANQAEEQILIAADAQALGRAAAAALR